MAKIKIEFEIENNYCYSQEKFCPFLRFIRFGTTPVCAYFEQNLTIDETERIVRLEECVEEFNESNI